MNIYDIEFVGLDFGRSENTRTILAKDFKEAAEIADKMLKAALNELWEDIDLKEIRYVTEITVPTEFIAEVKAKGEEIKKAEAEEKNP